MENNTILHNYQDWLEHHKMPAGKKKTLVAAIELFSQQGYNGTSTAQIAEKAGISQATIFKYFKTKSDLLSEIMQPMIPELKRDFFPKLQTYTKLEEVVHFIVQDRFQKKLRTNLSLKRYTNTELTFLILSLFILLLNKTFGTKRGIILFSKCWSKPRARGFLPVS